MWVIEQKIDKEIDARNFSIYYKLIAEANRIAQHQKTHPCNFIDLTHLSDEQFEHFCSEMERLDALDDLHLST